MSLYDTYSQKFQAAMAPAIDYYQRTQAAAAYGLDYNQLSAQQINQIFGPSQQYNASTSNSSLNNLAYQATGGYNPYIQQLGMAAMYQNQYYSPYAQMPYGQYGMNPQMMGYPQQYPVSQYPVSQYPVAQYPTQYMPQYGMGQYQYPTASTSSGLDINTLFVLLSQLQGLQSGQSSSSSNSLYSQVYANAIGALSGSDYDDEYIQKLEQQILEQEKNASMDDGSDASVDDSTVY